MTVSSQVNNEIIDNAKKFTKEKIENIAAEIDINDRFPDELLEPMAEEGFFGIHYPKAIGGEGHNSHTAYQVLTEIAKGSAGITLLFIVHWMAVDVLIKFGTSKQKDKYLEDLLKGKKIAAFSLTEPQAGSDLAAIETTAAEIDDGWSLNGKKYFCTNGNLADLYFIASQTKDAEGKPGMSLFIVENKTDGLKVGAQIEKMGCRSSNTTTLLLNNCFVPQENILGEINQGFRIAMYGLTEGRLGMAAMGQGIAEAAFETAVEYANKREAFGKTIGNLYSIQEMITDMHVKIEASKLLIRKCCDKRDQGKNYATESSVAKIFIAEAVNKICHDALQILGGHGYVKNNDVERYARDGRLIDIGVGASEVLKMTVGNAVLNS